MVVQLELSLEKQEPVGKAVPRKSNIILNSDQITNSWRVVQCVLICLAITLLYICFKESWSGCWYVRGGGNALTSLEKPVGQLFWLGATRRKGRPLYMCLLYCVFVFLYFSIFVFVFVYDCICIFVFLYLYWYMCLLYCKLTLRPEPVTRRGHLYSVLHILRGGQAFHQLQLEASQWKLRQDEHGGPTQLWVQGDGQHHRPCGVGGAPLTLPGGEAHLLLQPVLRLQHGRQNRRKLPFANTKVE